MHLADAFIQSDLHCIQVTVFTFYQLLLSLGIEPMILALLAPCSTIWATGKLYKVTGCSLLQNRLPVSQSFSDGEAGDHAVDLGPPFAHVVLNVKHKRLLAKISIYYLPWSL